MWAVWGSVYSYDPNLFVMQQSKVTKKYKKA